MGQDLRRHWLNWDEDPWPAAVFWYSPGVRPRSVSLFHCQASMGAGCRSIWHCGIILGYLMSWCPRSFWGVPFFFFTTPGRQEPWTINQLGQGEHLKPIDGKSPWLSGGFFFQPIQSGILKHHQDHQVARGSIFQTPKPLRIWRLFFNPLGMSWAAKERSSQRRFSTQLLQSLAVTDATHKVRSQGDVMKELNHQKLGT